jgi:hypothetical protein
LTPSPYAVLSDEGNLIAQYASYASAYACAKRFTARTGREHRVARLEGGQIIPLQRGGPRAGAGPKPGSGRGNRNAAKPSEARGVQAGRLSRLAHERVELLARQWGISFRAALERCVEAAWAAHGPVEASRLRR